MCQLSNSEMPDVLIIEGLVVVFLMAELKMERKYDGFVCTALDQCSGSSNKQCLDMRLPFYLGFVLLFFLI